MEAITYSLQAENSSSDSYYRDVAAFTSRVLDEAGQRVGDGLAGFRAAAIQEGREPPRTLPEYALEVLYLGVLWRVYGSPDVSVDTLDNLLGWLGKSKRFDQASSRLRPWRDYLTELALIDQESILERVLSLADWFDAHSLVALGGYTAGVDRFLTEEFPAYQGREDEVLCGRRRVEYHLSMVATEILSRAFRDAFLAAERKIVIVPPCMKARPDGECQAGQTPLGARCAGCTPGCHVHQATRLGEQHGFEVFMLPEDLGVFQGGDVGKALSQSIGIVGVSCVLTNVDGGWQMKALGVPAQGLLLDYCGCSYHWHPQGIATDINLRQLLKTIRGT